MIYIIEKQEHDYQHTDSFLLTRVFTSLKEVKTYVEQNYEGEWEDVREPLGSLYVVDGDVQIKEVASFNTGDGMYGGGFSVYEINY